ncbi:MAG: phosphatase PAP2 family protein [Roseicyclus sp.]
MRPGDTDPHPGRTPRRALLVAAAACFCGFAALAAAVPGGATLGFDRALLLALRAPGDAADPLGPEWLEKAARDLTSLGSVFVLCLLAAAGVGVLLRMERGRAAVFVLASTGGAVLLSRLAKDLVDRPRPDLVPHGDMALSASFPSGHAMLSAATYLTLAGVATRMLADPRPGRCAIVLALALTGLVGASRVHLGVHWPTDVIAGWLGGAGWALLCLRVVRLGAEPGATPRQTGKTGRLET